MYKCLDIECIKDLDFRSGLATIKLIIAVTVRVIVCKYRDLYWQRISQTQNFLFIIYYLLSHIYFYNILVAMSKG